MEDYALPAAPEVPGYDVGRCLGRGGSAAVWLATQRSSAKEYALKCFTAGNDPDGNDSEESVRREIRVLSVLDHEHLVRAYDVVQVSGGSGRNLALTMDYAAGGSLGQLVASRGSLGAGETVTVLTPIAQALAYLHGQGFTHGDVSPGNILFTAHGKPLLADLGVARMVADATAVAGAGTEGFADPAPVDAVRAGLQQERDLYSLAAVGWFCLTGHPPGPGARRPPLPLLVPGVPLALAAALESGLQEDRRLRPSAAELAAAVHRSSPAAPVDLSVAVHATVIPQLLTRRALPGTARERRIERLRGLRRRFRAARGAGPRPAAAPQPTQPAAAASGAVFPVRGQSPGSAGTRPAARHSALDTARGRTPGRSSHLRPRRRSVRPAPARPPRRAGALRAAAAAVALLGVAVAVWALAGGGLPGPAPGFTSKEAAPVGEAGAGKDAGAAAKPGPDAAAPATAAAGLPPGVLGQLASQDPGEAVRGLARIRSRAFSSGDFRLLEEVNVPGSAAAAADGRISAALKESGRVLAGFDTVLTGVVTEPLAAAEGSGPVRAMVAVTASTPAYQERDAAGTVLAETSPAPEQRLLLVLARVEGRWRIQDILAAGTHDAAGTADSGRPAAGG